MLQIKNEQITVNPFRYGDPVKGDYYLPRPNLESFVAQFLFNRIYVVLIGPRRFGNTSFLLNLLKKLSEQSHSYVFVDIHSGIQELEIGVSRGLYVDTPNIDKPTSIKNNRISGWSG